MRTPGHRYGRLGQLVAPAFACCVSTQRCPPSTRHTLPHPTTTTQHMCATHMCATQASHPRTQTSTTQALQTLIAPASMSSPQHMHSSSSSSFKEKSFSGRHISFLHSPHTTLLRTILCGPGFCAAEQAKHSSCDRSTKDDPQSAQACRSVPERIWAK